MTSFPDFEAAFSLYIIFLASLTTIESIYNLLLQWYIAHGNRHTELTQIISGSHDGRAASWRTLGIPPALFLLLGTTSYGTSTFDQLSFTQKRPGCTMRVHTRRAWSSVTTGRRCSVVPMLSL